MPCRVAISLKGVEWFIYNKKDAYEALEKLLEKRGQAKNSEERLSDRFQTFSQLLSGKSRHLRHMLDYALMTWPYRKR
jgi:hypothetical protein